MAGLRYGRPLRVAALRVWMMMVGLCALAVPSLAAQVGQPPSKSPFRDIRKGHTFTVMGGYFGGSGGQLNVAPHNGTTFGGRYDIRAGGTIQIGLGISHGNLDRFIINPSLTNPRSGPVKQSVTFAELGLQFNLSGGKSWHRIAPFVGAGVGVAFAGDTPADTSRFDFGNKFYLAPNAGFRFFLSDRLHLRAEARAVFWKLTYPVIFQTELSEWTTSPWFQAGLGYSFSP